MPSFAVPCPESTITIILSILVGRTVADSEAVEIEVGKSAVRLKLTPAAFRILYLLAEAAYLDRNNEHVRPANYGYRATKVLSRDYAGILNHRFDLEETVVHEHIRELRKKLTEALATLARAGVDCGIASDRGKKIIAFHRGYGYRIERASIRVVDANDHRSPGASTAPPPPPPA